LRPEIVRRDLISNPSQSPVDWNDPDLDFARHSTSGVIGNPTTASGALGAELWEAVVNDVARTLYDLSQA